MTQDNRTGFERIADFGRALYELFNSLTDSVLLLVVPLAPAIVFGHAWYKASATDLGWLALLAGISAAFGLEIAGLKAYDAALGLWLVGERGKGALAFLLGAAYVVIGVVGIWFLDTAIAFAAVTFLSIPILYLARGFSAYIGGKRLEQGRTADLEQELDRARVDAEKQVIAAKAQAAADLAQMPVEQKRAAIVRADERMRLQERSRRPVSDAVSAPVTGPEQGPVTGPFARAEALLADDPDLSGAALARELGVSEGYGRKLRRKALNGGA